jgi:hypothetical protein
MSPTLASEVTSIWFAGGATSTFPAVNTSPFEAAQTVSSGGSTTECTTPSNVDIDATLLGRTYLEPSDDNSTDRR